MINALLPGLVPISPVVTWTTPSSIVYGTALSASQLNATANVAGTFAYHPVAGTVLDVGTNVLSVNFTPNDTFDYNTVTSTVAQVVMPAPLNVTAANTNRIYGLPNPAFQGTITGLQNGDNITAAYTCSATAASPVGTYPIVPNLIDPNHLETNYTVTLVNGTLTVQKAPSVITWTNPAPIVYGTALSSIQLNATANVPGSFVYNPTSGTVLSVGTNTLSVSFTPADTTDYMGATDSVSLVVTAPQIPSPAGEPLLPTWGVAALLAGLMALSFKYVAQRTNLPANDEGNRP
jgi:hypothetical protein